MKKRLIKLFNFCLMVVLLGMQNLLQGSWKVQKIEPAKE